MNILIFTQNYPRSYNEPIISGMVKNPFYLSQALKIAGHNIVVITSGDKKGEWNFNGVEVYCTGRGVLKGVVYAFAMQLKMFVKFLSLRKKKNFDIVHVHHLNLLALLFLRKLNLIKYPVIYTAHGTSIPELEASFKGVSLYKTLLRLNGKIQHFIDKITWRNADAVISPSRFQIKEMRELYGVPEEKIECIYNGVDNTRYFPDVEAGKKLRQKLGIPEDVSVVLYVGRIARKKGIHFLIKNAKDVIKELPNTRFLLVLGNMGRQLDYREEILKLIEQENLQNDVIIKENVTEKELPSYYNSADLCVFPSTGYESIPTVIYEAMACGKPIITQGSWGIPEVLEKVLLLEKDLESDILFRSIVDSLNKDELYRDLVKYNIHNVQQFYWKKIAEHHLELYKKQLVIFPGNN